MRAFIAILSLLLIAPAARAAQHTWVPDPSEGGARRFVAYLYRHYPRPPNDGSYDPTGEIAPRVFDAPMVALLRRDQQQAAARGGVLDGDPICDCQDDRGLAWEIRSVRLTGSGRAVAVIRLTFSAPAKPAVVDVQLSLVFTRGGWRIHDLACGDTPSLRDMFIEAAKPDPGAAE